MTHHKARQKATDVEETKTHVMAAGRELLLAAKGALGFCREFASHSVPESTRPELLKFFSKAISVADELGKGISGVQAIRRTAEGVAKPIFSAIAKEMIEQKKAASENPHYSKPKGPKRTQRKGFRRSK